MNCGDADPGARDVFPIVGLGASAAGLEALGEFLTHTPVDAGVGFVVVSPQHPADTSLMPELVAKHTRMRVEEIVSGTRVEPNHVYVAPPGNHLVIRNRVLHLMEPDEQVRPLMPIDYFFSSLARDQKDQAIGVVLSGTGADGTLGLAEIKGATGMAMAAAEAAARGDGALPCASAAEQVDYVLPAAQLPAQLLAYVDSAVPVTPTEAVPTEAMEQIFALLRERTGYDLSAYDPATTLRRIERRMRVHHFAEPADYVQHLGCDLAELDILFKELLIGVTAFFRAQARIERDAALHGDFGSGHDITATEVTEMRMPDSESLYRRLFEIMTESVHIWRVVRGSHNTIETCRLVDANPATLLVWGRRSVDEIRGKAVYELFDPATAERHRSTIERVMTDGAPHSFERQTPDGRHRRLTSVAFGDYILTTGTDITAEKRAEESARAESFAERARLEEGLRQAHKMEAIGRLAAGVAHDIGNLLMGIDGCVAMALRQIEAEHPARPFVEQIADVVTSGAATTRQLAAFGGKRPGPSRVFDLGRCADRCETLLRRLLGSDIALELRRDPEPLLVLGDPGRFEQVMVNLAVNARHAMPSGGRLSIEVRAVTLAEADVRARPNLAAGEHVALVVEDNGCGMAEEVAKHAFEPFFTTREAGAGTGLGLATVYAAVQQAGGHVELTSVEGQGTRFEILFPRTRAPATIDAAPAAVEALAPFAARILLVEDDVLVRMSVRAYLEGAGYLVAEAGRGAEAMLLWQQRSEAIDLLVTDMVLPGRSGAELARELGERDPKLRVIYTSAHPQEWLAETGRLAPPHPVLHKPFSREQLLAMVREVLVPGSDADPPPPASDRDSPTVDVRATGPTRTILLVGDCDLAEGSVDALLARARWHVGHAASAREAVQIYREASYDIDVALIDYTLVDMHGDSLARELRQISPGIAVAYVSAYTDLDLDPTGPLLGKPIDPEVLIETLDRLIEEAAD